MKAQHIGPSEAVQIHKEIQSEFSVGVHWGTYDMGSKEVSYLIKTEFSFS